MLTLKFIPIPLLLISAIAWASPFQFRVEFDKASIYQGETVRCEFALYAQSRGVEVEVAKFPEFRGYWKENLALRQGKIPFTLASYTQPGWNRVVIGAYSLVPMMGEPNPQIQPMKIVVRPLGLGGLGPHTEQILFSKMEQAFKPKALPTLPPGREGFSGGVGNFNLSVDTPLPKFETGEPTRIQLTLRGEGNFQELNALQLPFPSNIKVLSKRAYTNGSGAYQSKTYEWTITVNAKEDVEIPPLTFTYFQPFLESYQTLRGVPIVLNHIPTPPKKTTAPPPPTRKSRTLLTEWTPYVSWIHQPLFWTWQIVLSLLGLCWLGLALRRKHQSAPKAQALPNPKELLLKAQVAYQAENWDAFLVCAETITAHTIQAKASEAIPKGTPRATALKLTAKSLGPHLTQDAQKILNAHEAYFYSPQKKQKPADPEGLLESLSRIAEDH